MICSTVNRAFFIAVSLEDGFYLKLAEFSGLRSLGHCRHRITMRLSQDPNDLLFRELPLFHPAPSRRPVSRLIDCSKTRGQVSSQGPRATSRFKPSL